MHFTKYILSLHTNMKVVVDDKIPYIRETLATLADEVVYLKGSEIGPEDVMDADALIVRTRTRCGKQLLQDSKVQFVGTATIGYDHLDTKWLEQHGIEWTNCPGCNSGSVAQYVESVLLLLQQDGCSLQQMTLGVIGCGHVGSKVRRVGERLGMRVLVNDPPLGHADFVSLDVIERQADVITFHVPLDETTHYLADAAFFNRLEKQPVIINSSRGGVVCEQALLQALDEGKVSRAVIDTWEHEPAISRTLLYKTFIGTPHIAGYSADGKVNADNMIVAAFCRHFSLPVPAFIKAPKLPADFKYTGHPLELYNAMDDSQKLKTHPELFEELRGDYPLRREKFET